MIRFTLLLLLSGYMMAISTFSYMPTTPKLQYIPNFIPVENILYDNQWVMVGNRDTYIYSNKDAGTKVLCARLKKEDVAQYVYGIYSYFKTNQDLVGMVRFGTDWYVFSATNLDYKKTENLLKLLETQIKTYKTTLR